MYPSCGSDKTAALDAREAWLRDWEVTLTVRDAELRRREQALETAAQRVMGSGKASDGFVDPVVAETEEQLGGDDEEGQGDGTTTEDVRQGYSERGWRKSRTMDRWMILMGGLFGVTPKLGAYGKDRSESRWWVQCN